MCKWDSGGNKKTAFMAAAGPLKTVTLVSILLGASAWRLPAALGRRRGKCPRRNRRTSRGNRRPPEQLPEVPVRDMRVTRHHGVTSTLNCYIKLSESAIPTVTTNPQSFGTRPRAHPEARATERCIACAPCAEVASMISERSPEEVICESVPNTSKCHFEQKIRI